MTERQGHLPAGPDVRTTPAWDRDWPPGHPLAGYDPAVQVPCPACGMRVGVRNGRLNKHLLTAGIGLLPGERPSPLGPDGWCRATT